MAKAQAAARLMTEVAPPQVVSIMRRRKVPRSLETIAEDDREQLVASDHGHHQHHQAASSSGFAAAWSKSATPQAQARARKGGFMRELSKYFSDAHAQAGGSWESGHRRVVYAQPQFRNNGAP